MAYDVELMRELLLNLEARQASPRANIVLSIDDEAITLGRTQAEVVEGLVACSNSTTWKVPASRNRRFHLSQTYLEGHAVRPHRAPPERLGAPQTPFRTTTARRHIVTRGILTSRFATSRIPVGRRIGLTSPPPLTTDRSAAPLQLAGRRPGPEFSC
jgi:hypothetical protein